MDKKGNENLKFEIILGVVAKWYDFRVGDILFVNDLPSDYNGDLGEALVNYLLQKRIYLNKRQAIDKFGEKVDSPIKIDGLFYVQNHDGEWVYIDPYQPIIVEKEYRYFPFFFAIRLMQFFESIEALELYKFIDYQLTRNFENNSDDYKSFLANILNRFSATVFFGKVEDVFEAIKILKGEYNIDRTNSNLQIFKRAGKQEDKKISDDYLIKECFDSDYWIYYKENIEKEFFSRKYGEKKYLIKTKNGQLHWNVKKEILVAIIMILDEYNYFSKRILKNRKKGLWRVRHAFETDYNIDLSQFDKPKDKEIINLDLYKKILPFIIPVENITKK